MIEPEVTAALGRRCLAFLIDSSLVVATGLGAAYQQSKAYAVVGRDFQGQPLVDPADFPEIEQLVDFEVFGRAGIFGRPFVRFQEIGDTVRVFGADSYLFGFLAALVTSAVVFALVPLLLHRTPGMLPLGIGIRTVEGQRPGPNQHLLRYVGLAADLAPFVLPGALGLLTAGGSKLHQRIGDRIAGTTVVGLRALELAEIPTEHLDLRLNESTDRVPPEPLDRAAADSAGQPVDQPVDLDAPPSTSPVAAPTVAPPPAPSPIQALEAAEAAARASESTSVDRGAAPSFDGTPATPPTSAPPPSTTREPWPTDPPTAGRAPSQGFGDLLPPPPVHRTGGHEQTLGRPATPAAAPDRSVPADPSPPPAGVSRSLAERVDAPTADLPNQAPLSRELAEPEARGSDENDHAAVPWARPKAQPAPVWQPAPLEPAPIEAPDPSDGRTLDDVVLPEPSTGSLVSESPLPENSPLRQAETQAGSKTPTAKAPVWSDKWRAWMYWDPKRKCWLRHDTETNKWEPVS